MSGPKLAKRLIERRPQMRVMLMAGYPGGALLVLNYGWHYIEKPFLPSLLVNKIKDVLRGETREQTTDRFDTLKMPRKSNGWSSLDFHPAPLPGFGKGPDSGRSFRLTSPVFARECHSASSRMATGLTSSG